MHTGQPIKRELLEALNQANGKLGPRVAEHSRAIRRERNRRRAERRAEGRRNAGPDPDDIDEMDQVPSW